MYACMWDLVHACGVRYVLSIMRDTLLSHWRRGYRSESETTSWKKIQLCPAPWELKVRRDLSLTMESDAFSQSVIPLVFFNKVGGVRWVTPSEMATLGELLCRAMNRYPWVISRAAIMIVNISHCQVQSLSSSAISRIGTTSHVECM